MNYSFAHYLRHFPLRYYLSGGLFATSEPVCIFFLSSKSSAVLLVRGQRVVAFEENIGDLPDAPPVPGKLDPGVAGVRSFTSKLLSRNRLRGKTGLVLLPDCPATDVYCNVHLVANLRESTVEGTLESLAEDPRQVIGAWDEYRTFRWALLDAGLRPISGYLGRKHSQVVVLGLPADYCSDCEGWADRQNAALLGLVPIQVACIAWFLRKVPIEEKIAFLVIRLTGSLAIAVIKEKKIILFRQYDEDFEYVRQEISRLAKELSPAKEPYLCIWSCSPEEDPIRSEIRGLQLAGPLLQEIERGQIVINRHRGASIATNSPIALLLRWIAQEFQ